MALALIVNDQSMNVSPKNLNMHICIEFMANMCMVKVNELSNRKMARIP